jgi:hypothetical protein
MHGLATATIAAPRPSPPWETVLLRPIPSEHADMASGVSAVSISVPSERSRMRAPGQRPSLPDVHLKMWSPSRKGIRRRRQTCEAFCRQFATTR